MFYPMMHTNGTDDTRYQIQKEFCGKPTRQHVVRFCGEWVGSRGLIADAIKMADHHDYKRTGVHRPRHLVKFKQED